jgi:hypothetical protein
MYRYSLERLMSTGSFEIPFGEKQWKLE